MTTRRRPAAPAAHDAGFNVQAFRAILAAVVAKAGPDDDSVEVTLARGLLAKTCDGCGADLDDAGRADPAHLCPACRGARPPVA